jgi:hypothetical protein
MGSLNAPLQLIKAFMSVPFYMECVLWMVDIFKNLFCGELVSGKGFDESK